jgi:hypothetical protein
MEKWHGDGRFEWDGCPGGFGVSLVSGYWIFVLLVGGGGMDNCWPEDEI